jgi:hypothetical protein
MSPYVSRAARGPAAPGISHRHKVSEMAVLGGGGPSSPHGPTGLSGPAGRSA